MMANGDLLALRRNPRAGDGFFQKYQQDIRRLALTFYYQQGRRRVYTLEDVEQEICRRIVQAVAEFAWFCPQCRTHGHLTVKYRSERALVTHGRREHGVDRLEPAHDIAGYVFYQIGNHLVRGASKQDREMPIDLSEYQVEARGEDEEIRKQAEMSVVFRALARYMHDNRYRQLEALRTHDESDAVRIVSEREGLTPSEARAAMRKSVALARQIIRLADSGALRDFGV